MSELNDKVITAKNALMSALGENVQKYLNNMKLWFRQKCTKEEFDLESRRLLNPEKMQLHNKFLLAILNKIDAFQIPQQTAPISTCNNTKNSRKRKRASRPNVERTTFEPYVLEYILEDSVDTIRLPNSGDDSNQSIPAPRYCVQEFFLPDAGFIMGRLLVGAWENGLINVDDAVAEYVSTAVQFLLKNIISTIIMKRKHYKITSEGAYYYDVGTSIKDPFVRNTVTKQKIDDSPVELDKEITSVNLLRRNNDDTIFLSACEELFPSKRRVITLRDLYRALQDRNVIQSHTVYSLNMERLTQMLH